MRIGRYWRCFYSFPRGALFTTWSFVNMKRLHIHLVLILYLFKTDGLTESRRTGIQYWYGYNYSHWIMLRPTVQISSFCFAIQACKFLLQEKILRQERYCFVTISIFLEGGCHWPFLWKKQFLKNARQEHGNVKPSHDWLRHSGDRAPDRSAKFKWIPDPSRHEVPKRRLLGTYPQRCLYFRAF